MNAGFRFAQTVLSDDADGADALDMTTPDGSRLSAWQQRALANKVAHRQEIRKAMCAPWWAAAVAALMTATAPAASSGAVLYVDPLATSNGTGTFSSPFNVVPGGATYVNNTLLFAEGSTYVGQINNSTVAGYNIGTYSRLDGSRVYDRSRMATICANNVDAGGGITHTAGLQFSGAITGTVVISGVRITGARNAAGVAYGAYAGANAAGSLLIVERCVIDDIVGTSVGNGISGRCERMVLRFNEISASNLDLMWLRAATAAGRVEIYGNRLIVGASTTQDGPDAIQLDRSAGGVYGNVLVHNNWIEHCAPTKQGFIVSGNTPAAGTERIRIFNNFFFGLPDLAGLMDLSGNGSGHVAFNIDQVGAQVYGNLFDGWRTWGTIKGDASNPALFAYNICINSAAAYQSSTSPMAGTPTSGSDFVWACHNTFIALGQLGSSTPADIAALRVAGTNNVVRNNIFLGAWRHAMQLTGNAGQAESGNLIFGVADRAIVGSAALSELAASATDLRVNPLLDLLGRPMLGSPVVGAAAPVVDWKGALLHMPDIFGRLADDPRRQWIGAAQGYAG